MINVSKHVKVTVTGAAGNISYALLFRIASGQMFGPDVTVDLQLLELEQSLSRLNGLCMELIDCAFPLLKTIKATSDPKQAIDGANWVILIGAIPRKVGMERVDLLRVNGGIFSAQGKAINDYAASDVRVLVVGNPCNTNCFITMSHAPDLPKDRFFAMTYLDQNRAYGLLAEKLATDVANIKHLNIWGNHSPTLYPDFYHAVVNDQAVVDAVGDENWLKNDFISQVQQRGTTVLKARGASSAASAANGVIDTIYCLTHDTPDDKSFSVAQPSKGQYGIQEGLIFSFPSQVKEGILHVVPGLEHNAFSEEKINISQQELQKEYEIVTKLNLVG